MNQRMRKAKYFTKISFNRRDTWPTELIIPTSNKNKITTFYCVIVKKYDTQP